MGCYVHTHTYVNLAEDCPDRYSYPASRKFQLSSHSTEHEHKSIRSLDRIHALKLLGVCRGTDRVYCVAPSVVLISDLNLTRFIGQFRSAT